MASSQDQISSYVAVQEDLNYAACRLEQPEKPVADSFKFQRFVYNLCVNHKCS